MKRPYYIMRSGRLSRKQNTLFFMYESEGKEPSRKIIPIEDVGSIYVFGELDLNTKLINYLSQKNIPVHFFNYHGYYSSTLYPRDYLVSGFAVVDQARNYLDPLLRLELARKFVEGAAFNILKNLRYYNKRQRELEDLIAQIEKTLTAAERVSTVPELMAVEGHIRVLYYSGWMKILDETYEFRKRTRQPPDNIVNALISFSNMLVYTTSLGEIYHTQLHPAISFLHEPGERRFSLSLDMAEIFKPILADRMIFKLLNQKMLQKKHFVKEANYCYLNEEGKKILLREYDERLKTTIKHRTLGRNVSYRHLIRLECYKLVKHITGIEPYKPFKIWW